MRTILLLLASNVFMTIAWYGHLKHKAAPLWAAILLSWCIALPEYMLQVPANRWGHAAFNAPQLKIIQEIVSITVFVGFCLLYLREPLRWNHAMAFVLIAAAAFFCFMDPAKSPTPPAAAAVSPGFPPPEPEAS